MIWSVLQAVVLQAVVLQAVFQAVLWGGEGKTKKLDGAI
jgi:hypothetical protein